MSTAPMVGRRTAVNINDHDFETIAEHISDKLKWRHCAFVVEVRRDGGIRMTEAHNLSCGDMSAIVSSAGYIGTYTRSIRVEELEGDILHWLQNREAP